jgi:hypothetical protein
MYVESLTLSKPRLGYEYGMNIKKLFILNNVHGENILEAKSYAMLEEDFSLRFSDSGNLVLCSCWRQTFSCKLHVRVGCVSVGWMT